MKNKTSNQKEMGAIHLLQRERFSLLINLKDSPIFADPYLLKLWMLCLIKASYIEHEKIVGNQVVNLKPGEFVTWGYALADDFNRDAAQKNKVTPRTIWRWLKFLEKMKMLDIKTTNKFSVITVISWNKHQDGEQ